MADHKYDAPHCKYGHIARQHHYVPCGSDDIVKYR